LWFHSEAFSASTSQPLALPHLLLPLPGIRPALPLVGTDRYVHFELRHVRARRWCAGIAVNRPAVGKSAGHHESGVLRYGRRRILAPCCRWWAALGYRVAQADDVLVVVGGIGIALLLEELGVAFERRVETPEQLLPVAAALALGGPVRRIGAKREKLGLLFCNSAIGVALRFQRVVSRLPVLRGGAVLLDVGQ